jgi:hypothetical protein
MQKSLQNRDQKTLLDQSPFFRCRFMPKTFVYESNDVVNYCFPKEWPADREQSAGYIGEWLRTEARYLAS